MTQYTSRILAALIFFIAVASLSFQLGARWTGHQTASGASRETSYERVMRTGTIRCGYAIWHPELIKDANTGRLSGYDYDVMNKLGEVLGLKVQWVEETGWGGAAEEALISGRYDMVCNGVWGPPARSKAAIFSQPFVRHPLFVVVYPGLKQNQTSFLWLNDTSHTMAVMKGTIFDILAQEIFPKAKLLDTMTLSSDGDILQDVKFHKADFSISNATSIDKFLQNNPAAFDVISEPVATVSGAFLLANDDPRLKFVIDKGIDFLLDSGFVQRTMEHYMGSQGRAWLLPLSR